MKFKMIDKLILSTLIISKFAVASNFKPGTYIGSAPGYKDNIQVEVKVNSKKIESVKIVKHDESPLISDVALQRIPAEVVEYQSLGVDEVAGATATSKGVIAAITRALRAAGGDLNTLRKKVVTNTVKENREYNADVIVVGGGGAGLAAAVSAHQNGATVLVLEKMPRVGGNTLIAGSAYNAVDPKRQKPLGIEDSVDLHYKHTFEGGDKLGKPVLIKTFVENSYPGIEWLESLGMGFKDEIFTVLGALYPRSHKPEKPLGTGFIGTYEDYISKNKGITVLTDTKVEDLILENGRVVGVKALGRKENIVAKAKNGVVIATGGFGANVELRQHYNSKLTKDIPTTNHPGATGEVMFMAAEKAAANLVGLQYIQLLPMGDPINGSLSGNIEGSVEDRIFVNKSGKRFVAEDERRDVMTNALFEQEDAYMWTIVDAHTYPTEQGKNNFNETIEDLVKKGRAFKGETVEELATKIKVDPVVLKDTIDKFNVAVENKTDEFGRKLFANKLDKAPFYAGPRVPTVHHTMGGVEINEKTQVLDKAGNPIPGLFAAGEVTGGLHGSNRLGGNALAEITVFGKIAGEEAAKNK
ncbi:MAG: flavocytochrome c [Cetobacterium sp.]|uniref:flavocytochrome c n=1 Tax=uncultured Cetobacterium sp. TaxID=527638 RepID=UPI0025F351B3|nr:flavocytochrome c [uncultured Cetobacterium sp.]